LQPRQQGDGFSRCGTGAIPDRILSRQKEQFSDGVGYGWIDSLKTHADKGGADVSAHLRPAFPAGLCAHRATSFAKSADPSGRAVKDVHHQATGLEAEKAASATTSIFPGAVSFTHGEKRPRRVSDTKQGDTRMACCLRQRGLCHLLTVGRRESAAGSTTGSDLRHTAVIFSSIAAGRFSW
jgi:hypothetical protein